MTRRVRRRRPRVPPRKGRQPLPQFGAGADPIDLANFTLGMLGITPMKKQRGGAMPAWFDEIDRAIRSWHNPNWKDPSKKQRGGRLRGLRDFGLGALHKAMMGGSLTREQASMMKGLMMATDPRRLGIFPKRGQRGAGLLSIFTRPLARLFGKKITKQAAKAVAKRVAKKAAKKAATGAVTAGASWATQKALDRI